MYKHDESYDLEQVFTRFNEVYKYTQEGLVGFVEDRITKKNKWSYVDTQHTKNLYQQHKVKVLDNDKVKQIPVYTFWLNHQNRENYLGLTFEPTNQKIVGGYINTFTGWAVEPIPCQEEEIEPFLRLLKVGICYGDEEIFNYVIRWFAHIFQKPKEKPGVCLVLRSEQGVGKGSILGVIHKILGSCYVSINDFDKVTDKFNIHLKNRLLINLDEAVWGHQGEGVLKTLITEKVLVFEEKNKTPIQVSDYARYIITSNSSFCAPVGQGDRRYCVLACSDVFKKNSDFWKEFNCWFEEKNGAGKVLYYLLNCVDLSNFVITQFPKTSAHTDLEDLSLGREEAFIKQFISTSDLLTSVGVNIPAVDLDTCYTEWIKSEGRRGGGIGRVGVTIQKIFGGIRKRKTTGKREWFYAFPSRLECMEKWVKSKGGNPSDWFADYDSEKMEQIAEDDEVIKQFKS